MPLQRVYTEQENLYICLVKMRRDIDRDNTLNYSYVTSQICYERTQALKAIDHTTLSSLCFVESSFYLMVTYCRCVVPCKIPRIEVLSKRIVI